MFATTIAKQGRAVTDTYTQIKNKAWTELSYYELGRARDVPTMLSRHEQLLYFWLGANMPDGEGDIVDLGSFIGGSTACLASGHSTALKSGHVHAFDNFTADERVKKRLLYPAGIAEFEGRDILNLSRELLSPWKDRVAFHKGDIADQTWDGTPIQVLTLDASKIAAKMDRMAEIFFPSLVPGSSIIVQQDFLHFSQPWVAVQMELYQDYFEFLAYCPNDTMVYRCTRQIDEEALEAGETEFLTDAEMFDLLEAARARHADLGLDHLFEDIVRALEFNPRQRTAWKFRKPPA